MAKNVKKVEFLKKDGKEPTRGPGGLYNLLLPLAVRLPPGQSTVVDLGLACDHALQLVLPKYLSDAGIRLTNIERVVDARDPVKVGLKNDGKGPLSLGPGETVVRGYVLDNTDFA
jgi:hypothetical protein